MPYPLWQLRLARNIRGATVHALSDGHVACGHALFGSFFSEACDDVAARLAQAKETGAKEG